MWGAFVSGGPAAEPRASRSARLTALAALASGLSACATVPPGHLGVVLRSDGVEPQPLVEGSHFLSPWSQVTLYDVRVDEHTENLGAVSADGTALEAKASVLTFHAAPGEVVALAGEVGPNFYAVVVLPIVSSTVRRVLAGLRADQLDTAGIRRAQAMVTRDAADQLRPFHIIVDSVDLRTLNVLFTSAAYAAVVETGVEEQKVYLARKRIELAKHEDDVLREAARGIAAAHAIVAPTLTPDALSDRATRAWSRLLTAPSSSVEFRASDQDTMTEVSP
jgi:regulator of protease activity HflC (stomatin/prohibitin superfamily)